MEEHTLRLFESRVLRTKRDEVTGVRECCVMRDLIYCTPSQVKENKMNRKCSKYGEDIGGKGTRKETTRNS
jgi:hypothetical protein